MPIFQSRSGSFEAFGAWVSDTLFVSMNCQIAWYSISSNIFPNLKINYHIPSLDLPLLNKGMKRWNHWRLPFVTLRPDWSKFFGLALKFFFVKIVKLIQKYTYIVIHVRNNDWFTFCLCYWIAISLHTLYLNFYIELDNICQIIIYLT